MRENFNFTQKGEGPFRPNGKNIFLFEKSIQIQGPQTAKSNKYRKSVERLAALVSIFEGKHELSESVGI